MCPFTLDAESTAECPYTQLTMFSNRTLDVKPLILQRSTHFPRLLNVCACQIAIPTADATSHTSVDVTLPTGDSCQFFGTWSKARVKHCDGPWKSPVCVKWRVLVGMSLSNGFDPSHPPALM